MVLGLALSASMAYYLFSHGEVFNKVIHTLGLFLALIIAQFAAVIGLTLLNQRLTATIATLIYIFLHRFNRNYLKRHFICLHKTKYFWHFRRYKCGIFRFECIRLYYKTRLEPYRNFLYHGPIWDHWYYYLTCLFNPQPTCKYHAAHHRSHWCYYFFGS